MKSIVVILALLSLKSFGVETFEFDVALKEIHKFIPLKNNNKVDLKITRAYGTYPCQVDFPRKMIKPGEQYVVEVYCRSVRHGEFVKKITLFSNLGKKAIELKGTSKSIQSLQYGGFTPESNQAKEGLESILAGGDYKYGIPQKIFKANFARFTREKLFKIGNIPSPEFIDQKDFENKYMAQFKRTSTGFKKLPLGLSTYKYQDADVVNTNCFSCHSSVVDGMVLAGAPNRFFDATAQRIQTSALLKMYNTRFLSGPIRLLDNIVLSKSEEESLMGFKDYYEKIVKPVLKDTSVKGDNPGPYVVWQTLTKLSEDNRLAIDIGKVSRDEVELLQKPTLPQIQPQPWWNLKYKKKAFWNMDVTHLSPASFSLNHLDHHDLNHGSIEARMQETQKHLDFAIQVKAPVYSKIKSVDPVKASRGYKLYNSNQLSCYKCHGAHDQNGKFLSATFPEQKYDVGTDPEFAKINQTFEKLYKKTDLIFSEFLNTEYIGETTGFLTKKAGYIAPPLVGIWASAPYLHNGSVPTLKALLSPVSARPVRWQASLEPLSYNHTELGVEYRSLSEEKYLRMKTDYQRSWKISKFLFTQNAETFRSVYNTEDFGRSNGGHNFTDDLSADEIEDLVEYLKLF